MKRGRLIGGPASDLEHAAYLQTGSPSAAELTSGFVVLMPIPQVWPLSCVCVFVAVQKPAPVAIVGAFTPVDTLNFSCVSVPVYFAESEKKASSAVTRLRRSDFMAVMYAFDFVLANFGIAIAARIPMITTTIRSSIRVKPRRVVRMLGLGLRVDAPRWEGECGAYFVGRRLLRPSSRMQQ